MQPRQFNQFRFRKNASKDSKDFEYSKAIPYIAPVLILSGFFKLAFYYSFFHINIILFLSFSEILTSFFDFLAALILIVAFFFASAALIVFKNPVGAPRAKRFWIYFLVALAIPIVAVILISNHFDNDYNTVIFPFFMGIFYLLSIYFGKENKIDKPQLNSLSVCIAFSGISLWILSLWLIAFFDSSKVKKYKKYYNVNITYKDSSSFKSDSSSYYIGNTEHYLFIYNEKKSTSKVEKMDDVKSIEFPKKSNL